ncbi:hypothetical protein D4M61_29245, partial [Klebsiella pneumoniae]|uniref:hypothetical protein n=1 Tax=Klebsiella pneumoniae TaxID=573 RepID=UPI0013FF6D30
VEKLRRKGAHSVQVVSPLDWKPRFINDSCMSWRSCSDEIYFGGSFLFGFVQICQTKILFYFYV